MVEEECVTMVIEQTKIGVGPQPKVGTITVPLDRVSLTVLKALQGELGLPNQSATLQKILSDYWWGRSPLGHNKWPSD
jgi:hypothetical protein